MPVNRENFVPTLNDLDYIPDMESIGARVRALREAKGMSQATLARLAKVSQPVIAALESGQQASTRRLPEIAAALEVDIATIDPRFETKLQIVPLERKFFSDAAKLPVYAAAEGGAGHMIVTTDPIEWVPRPYTLESVDDAYAILVVGDSMIPAFEPGDTAWVNPRLPPMKNCDVVIYEVNAQGEARATIKRLIGWTETEWILQQWNPGETFRLPRSDWPKCHRVVGKFARR